MEYETPQFFRLIQYAEQADRDVVDMVSGNPDWPPPDSLRAGLRSYADGSPPSFQYPPSDGLQPLREEIAQRRGVDPTRVVVTNGAAEANHLALACGLEQFSGTDVVLLDPVYPYYPGRAAMLGANVTLVPVGRDGLPDGKALSEAVSQETAAIVINTPNNPLGVSYPRETLQMVAEIATDADSLLISDEVYDHFDYGGRFESCLSLDQDAYVVTNSFSKSLAVTGLRVGYGIFPPTTAPDPAGSLGDHARTRHLLTNVTGARPSQAAVLQALRETGPEYFESGRDRLRDRIDTFTNALSAVGADYTEPDGGFYVMARFDGFPGTTENVERLIDEGGVAGMPGDAFGDARSDWIRFSLTTDRIETAAERLQSFFPV